MTGRPIVPTLSGRQAARWVENRVLPPVAAEVSEAVARIIEKVRAGGDEALLTLTEELDGIRPERLRVDSELCTTALERASAAQREALQTARRNLEAFHAAQKRCEEPVSVMPGVRAWREFRPIDRVGIYVPGGGASYPSSLLMAAVPARIAGCPEIAVCSPPGQDGTPAESVLAAARMMGIHEIYAVGGAQAIAALALGTETIRPVDKIFGPGGAWVNAAKAALYPRVAVDLPAGPSEVVIWADAEMRDDWVAAELLAQAEHGPDSLCVAVFSGEAVTARVAREVTEALQRAHANLPSRNSRRAAASSLAGSAILISRDDRQALEWVNDLAPEHLCLMRSDARDLLPLVRHAGSVFLGPFSAVAAGDYATGTNHVLPTGRRARGASGLSLDDFGRWVQVQEIDARGLERLARAVIELAEWEGLPAHAASIRTRLEGADGE